MHDIWFNEIRRTIPTDVIYFSTILDFIDTPSFPRKSTIKSFILSLSLSLRNNFSS